MILPIYLYGQPVLRKVAKPIDADYPSLNELIDNMFQTMYFSEGVGLAAPQVGLSIRLLVIDGSPMAEDFPECKDSKLTMINPTILEYSEQKENLEEGCLSIPGVHEKVMRSTTIKVRYLDAALTEHVDTFKGFLARIVQHEYDHLEGHVFTDNVSPLRRQLIAGKLTGITKGKARCDYKTK